ncbi:MAG: tetratricopeptide repeat protein, partial [Terriglobia bacterium]
MPRLSLLFLLLAAAAAAGKAQSPRAKTRRAPVSARLRTLAARAQARHGWKPLRRYAASTRSSEARGLAYFTLGYREYMTAEDGLAAEDLKNSASTGSSLEDFAEYYEALADAQLNDEAADGIRALTGFSDRHPGSIYRLRAVNLLASLLIKAGHPQRALAVLNAEPAARTHASSLLLVAQADEALPDDIAAARTYQQIYDSFPAVPESHAAATALDRLSRRMGSHYPEPSLEAQTRRAARLFNRGLYQEALSNYDGLLLGAPHSRMDGEWRIGRARCFIHMRQYSEAIAALAQPETRDPEMDARRLALKTHAYELSGDEPALLKTLDEIYRKYPHSPSYGDALAYAGGYFARQGYWQTAARYYLPLSQTFPEGRYAVEACWRVAWYDVLSGDLKTAQAALVDFLRRYPHASRAAAALYWLAQVERQQGEAGAAGKIDRLVAARYTNTYYGLKARRNLAKTGKEIRLETGANPLAATLADSGIRIPPRPTPPLAACSGTSPDESLLAPYATLDALSLRALGEQYLVDLIAAHP